jgi:poly-gamma-glutamate synthesis protein (capsule biosynthesis protein)
MPHWGPNMIAAPLRYVRRAAAELESAGASLVAGSSAHVFQGVAGRILFDMGDFIDDYAVDDFLRNDLGLLFQVTLDEHGEVTEIAAAPLVLEFCHTRLAEGAAHAWIRDRFGAACAEFGTRVHERDRWLVAEPA